MNYGSTGWAPKKGEQGEESLVFWLKKPASAGVVRKRLWRNHSGSPRDWHLNCVSGNKQNRWLGTFTDSNFTNPNLSLGISSSQSRFQSGPVLNWNGCHQSWHEQFGRSIQQLRETRGDAKPVACLLPAETSCCWKSLRAALLRDITDQ